MSGVGAALSSVDVASLFWALVLALASWLLSSVRLWVVAPEFRLRDVVQMTFVGIYYGTILPGQVTGDVMKAYRLSHGQAAPGQAAAATLIDRLIATVALFVLGALAAPWAKETPAALTPLFAAAAGSVICGMALFAQRRTQLLLVRWLEPGRSTGFRGLAARFMAALHSALQHPIRLAVCFLLAAVFHALCVAIHVTLGGALGIELAMPTWALVYAGVALILLLPVTVAGLGLREGGYVGLLALFGVAAPQSLSLSLLIFGYLLLGAALGWLVELTIRRPR